MCFLKRDTKEALVASPNLSKNILAQNLPTAENDYAEAQKFHFRTFSVYQNFLSNNQMADVPKNNKRSGPAISKRSPIGGEPTPSQPGVFLNILCWLI